MEKVKSQNKKKKYSKSQKPLFKNYKDLQQWVKKRQKGMSPFCYLNPNAGNVEYNNNMFNNMMGSNFPSSGDIDTGNSGADAGSGVGIGEALTREKLIKFSLTDNRTLKYFINENIELLNNNLEEFLRKALNGLSSSDFFDLIYILNTSGVKISLEMIDKL